MRKAILILLFLYVTSYVVFRQSRTQFWTTDGKAYVIFPAGSLWIYYVYRPLSYVDGIITGMRSHIGPHR